MTVIKMSSFPDGKEKETNNTPESAGKKSSANKFITEGVFIFSVFNAVATGLTSMVMLEVLVYHVLVEVYNMEPLQTNKRCVILLSILHIVAFWFTVDLLCNVGKVQLRRLIWSTIVTMIVTLAGMATTFAYLAFVGVNIVLGMIPIEMFWRPLCIIYGLCFISWCGWGYYTRSEQEEDQELETVEPSGFGDMNKLLVRNDEQSKKSGLEMLIVKSTSPKA